MVCVACKRVWWPLVAGTRERWLWRLASASSTSGLDPLVGPWWSVARSPFGFPPCCLVPSSVFSGHPGACLRMARPLLPGLLLRLFRAPGRMPPLGSSLAAWSPLPSSGTRERAWRDVPGPVLRALAPCLHFRAAPPLVLTPPPAPSPPWWWRCPSLVVAGHPGSRAGQERG